MITHLGRRVTEAALCLFAALGFCFVPLGQRTGLGHAKAIIATGPAKEARDGVFEAFDQLKSAVLGSGESSKPAAPAASASPSKPAMLKLDSIDGPDASVPYQYVKHP
ncbi:MAG: hypothetical protein R3B13_27350 [Polyangiaceae bacterium]